MNLARKIYKTACLLAVSPLNLFAPTLLTADKFRAIWVATTGKFTRYFSAVNLGVSASVGFCGDVKFTRI